MSQGSVLRRVVAAVVAFALAASGSAARAQDSPAAKLGAYNADIGQSSISGISSGAFMAVQFGTAWSSVIKGIGAIAGGPYECADGTELNIATGLSVLTATTVCMKASPSAPDATAAIAFADQFAQNGGIDDLANVAKQKVYLFNGYNDTVVNRKVSDALEGFYRHYLGTERSGNLFYQTAIGAGHSQVTVNQGSACQITGGEFINQCGYDQAGIILQHVYGTLHANSVTPGGQIIQFSQREFTDPFPPASFSMAETGFVYVPTICQAGAACRVHIALHGCKQSSETIGTDFVRHAGYNEWADANNIIVLYPQAAPSALGDFTMPVNPEGCWDWFGYTNSDYTRKAGRQIGALKAMLDRVTSGANAAHGIIDVSVPTLRNATQIDSSDTAIDLAWSPIAGADAYVVSRALDQGQALQPLGIVAGASFGDAGLLPAHSYRYQVQAVMNGAPGPQSSVVEATTRPTPPRCDAPGSCVVAR